MGKGGGSSGGGGKIQIPQALGSGPGSLYYNVFNPIGTFGSETLGSLGSLYNWATDLATGGNVSGQGASFPQNGLLADTGSQTYAPFTGQNGLSPQGNSLLGPILGGEYSALAGMGQTAADLSASGASSNLLTQGANMLNRGNRLVNMATTGTGLFPSQQAMINQSVASQQAATQQQLGNMGLGSSTVAKQLAGQISLSGAAAAGQLVQGNLQLGEAEQQLGVQTTQAGAQINEALFSEYQSIASQSQSMQNQLYSQAMQGMGMLGQMMNETLSAFGYSMHTQEDVLGANENEAAIQAQVNEQAAQASAAGFSSLMGGLGSIFGQSGSGSGGLLGGLGGLFGSAGSGIGGAGAGAFGTVGDLMAGAGSAGAAGSLGTLGSGIAGAVGGGGSAIGGIISALGAIFACQIARTVYGIDDPRWIDFREYLLFRAPRPVRRAYVNNASWFSAFLKRHYNFKKFVKWLMNLAILYDKATREIRER